MFVIFMTFINLQRSEDEIQDKRTENKLQMQKARQNLYVCYFHDFY